VGWYGGTGIFNTQHTPLDVGCWTDLSLNDFPLPNVTDFISVATPTLDNVPQTAPSREAADELPRNQWYYQYETNTHRRRHHHRPAPGDKLDRHRLKFAGVGGSDVTITWVSFMAILVTIDVVWFVHRMARTYSTAKLILYGCAAPTEGTLRFIIVNCVTK